MTPLKTRIAEGQLPTLGMELANPRLRRAWSARTRVLLGVLEVDDGQGAGEGAGSMSLARRISRAASTHAEGSRPIAYLVLAVLRGEIPLDSQVIAAARALDLEGPEALLRVERLRLALHLFRGDPAPDVEVLRHEILVDVHHTATHDVKTGIQRVVREVVGRWSARRPITLVRWSDDQRRLIRVTEEEARRAGAVVPAERGLDSHALVAYVPWGARYVIPELAAEAGRAARLRAIARFSGVAMGVVGYDCVPITVPETVGEGMARAFADWLSVVKHADCVAGISEAATLEYRGVISSLPAQGLTGPATVAVALPVVAQTVTLESLETARRAIGAGADPVLLCVGSHEPRKNHLALLHAAELLWRAGHRFQLTFVGSSGWRNEDFFEAVHALQRRERPVSVMAGASDDVLFAAYRLAWGLVFPSIHEGFGLPIAEALASGTPVITSRFGSMAEVAEGGGALLVDPYDDHAIADAMLSLLTNRSAHEALAAAARAHPRRTWDDYADDLWSTLAEPEEFG